MSTVVAAEAEVVPPPQAGVDTAPLRRLLADLRRSTRRWIWVESLALVCLAGAVVFWKNQKTSGRESPAAMLRPTF